MTQPQSHENVIFGPFPNQASSVARCWREGLFKSEDEARGAFRFAEHQAVSGMGLSIAGWMGLSNKEFANWHRHEALPPLYDEKEQWLARLNAELARDIAAESLV